MSTDTAPPVLYDDEEHLYEVLRGILKGEQRPLPPETLRGIPEQLDWKRQAGQFDDLFDVVADRDPESEVLGPESVASAET